MLFNNWQNPITVSATNSHYPDYESEQLSIPNRLYSFSDRVRREIKKRANGKSEISKRDDLPLEASHLFHSKDPMHNNEENGKLMTIFEHFWYHLLHRGKAREIGLTEYQNEWATDQIRKRCEIASASMGLDYKSEVDTAKSDIESFLNGNG